MFEKLHGKEKKNLVNRTILLFLIVIHVTVIRELELRVVLP